MKRIDQLRTWIQSLVVTSGLSMLATLVWHLKPNVEGHVWWAVACFSLLLPCAKALMYVGFKGTDFLLGQSHWLRKALMQNDAFEGDWTDVVLDGDTGAVSYVSYCTMDFYDGFFRIFGTNWSPDGSRVLKFESYQSTFRDRIIYYQYRTHMVGFESRGYAYLEFLPPGAPPDSYEGGFIDFQHVGKRFFFAKKVSEPRRMPLSMEKQRSAAFKFLEEFQSEPRWKQAVPHLRIQHTPP